MDFHGLIWLIIFALAFRYGLPWFVAYRRKQRLAAAGIADIDMMDGLAFEQYLEMLFDKLGYKVERTRYVGDYGADLITHKGGIKTVIQAKRYTKAVGIKSVQEAVAAKGMYGLHGGDGRDEQHVHAGSSRACEGKSCSFVGSGSSG